MCPSTRNRILAPALTLAIGWLAPAARAGADEPSTKPLAVLFLGDQGHHRPGPGRAGRPRPRDRSLARSCLPSDDRGHRRR